MCLLTLGCSRKPAAGEPKPTTSATPAAVDSDEHDPPSPPRVIAPSTVTLSKQARARVTSLYISSADDGVTLKKTPSGWETAYAPHCKVTATPVEAALDSLLQQSAVPTDQQITSGSDFVLKIVVYADNEKLLKFALGPATQHGLLAQLDDGSTVDLRHFRRELFPSNPHAWCEAP